MPEDGLYVALVGSGVCGVVLAIECTLMGFRHAGR